MRTDLKTWPGFERLVAALQHKLAPTADVRWNDTVIGRSGTRRQIDVAVRARVGTTDLLVVIECKDYKDKVGIDLVEAFIAKYEDAGGHQGVLVARTGFTKDALARAERAGIITAVLRPARDEDWGRYLRSFNMKIVARVIVLDDLRLVLADGREVAGDPVQQLEDHLGESAFLDHIVESWLSTNKWEDGKPIKLSLAPPPRLPRDEDDDVRVTMIKCCPRWDDGFAVESTVVRPEDWIFVRYFADGRMDDEKHFFVFKELEQIGNAFVRAV
jgi:hypothetical protein